MKVEDLMIGDWVNLNFDVDYKTGNLIYGHVQVASINKDGTIDVDCTFDNSKSMQDGWCLKLIEPIPLTPEILEKNDILYEKQSFYYVIEDVEDLECTYYIYQTVQEDWAIGVDTGAYNCSVFARIKYVHDLQHALKLCGIDKKIVV